MTKVQQRLTALFVAVLLAACGALALSTAPQKAYADTLVAGSTFTSAKNMALVGKSLTATDDTSFSSKNYVKYYKFRTSTRNSSYKITVQSFDGEDLDVQVYDSAHFDIGRIEGYNFTTDGKKSRLCETLDRGATYYVEVSRATHGTARADYKIAIKEVVTPPATPTKVRALSKAKKSIRLKYAKPRNADGFQVAVRKATATKWTKYYTKNTQYVFWNLTKTSKKYEVRVRAYREVNKKKYYSSWSDAVTLKPNGKKKVYYEGN